MNIISWFIGLFFPERVALTLPAERVRAWMAGFHEGQEISNPLPVRRAQEKNARYIPLALRDRPPFLRPKKWSNPLEAPYDLSPGSDGSGGLYAYADLIKAENELDEVARITKNLHPGPGKTVRQFIAEEN